MSNSLFTPRPTGPIESSIAWLTGTMLGSVATSACVIAVAFVGFQMLSGKLPILRGLRVTVGCFLLLGAPVVAASIIGSWQRNTGQAALPSVSVEAEDPRGDLPPSDYSPYAGASVR